MLIKSIGGGSGGGSGLPNGGLGGQVLGKLSEENQDVAWVDQTGADTSTPVVRDLTNGKHYKIIADNNVIGLEETDVNVPAEVISPYIAGTNLSGHRAAFVDTDGKVRYADNSDPATAWRVVGVTTGAAVSGAPVEVCSAGLLIEPSWSWTLGMPVFLGANGVLTQVCPSTGFVLILGIPASATALVVSIKQPIAR